MIFRIHLYVYLFLVLMMIALFHSSISNLSCLISASSSTDQTNPTTTTTTTTTTTLNVPQGQLILPPYFAEPFINRPVFFHWDLSLSQQREWILQGTFVFDASTSTKFHSSSSSSPSSFWIGIGLKSPSGMRGPLVVCKVSSSVEVFSPSCDLYMLPKEMSATQRRKSAKASNAGIMMNNDDDLPSTEDEGQPILWQQDDNEEFININGQNVTNTVGRTKLVSTNILQDGAGYITFETIVQLSQRADSTAFVAREQLHRVIFARGPYRTPSSEPKIAGAILPHTMQQDDTIELLIDFDSGVVQRFEQIDHAITFYVMAAVVPVSVFIGMFDTHRHFPRVFPGTRNILSVFGLLTYLGLLVMYMTLRYSDYQEAGKENAEYRVLGDGASFVLSCMIFPVSKRGLFHDGYGVPHERAIKYHLLQALLLVLFTFIHMILWVKEYSFAFVARWWENDSRSHLPGLLSFLVMLGVIGPALLRHQIWRLFRFSHYFTVFIYFFAVLHFPPLMLGVLPGLLLHLAATAITRYRESTTYHQFIEAAHYDEEAGIVSIDILRSSPALPGQYFMLSMPELNSGESHPFSVAKMLPIGNHTDPALCRHRVSQLSSAGGIGSPSAYNNKEFDDWLLRPPLSGQLTTDLVGGDSANGLIDVDGNPILGGNNNNNSADVMNQNTVGPLAGGVDQNNSDKKTREEQDQSAPQTILSFNKPNNDWCYLRLMVKVNVDDRKSWTYRLAQSLKKKRNSSNDKKSPSQLNIIDDDDQNQQLQQQNKNKNNSKTVNNNKNNTMIPLPFANFKVHGPYGGCQEVNPAVYCQFIFVAAGVGINPLIYTLQNMSLGMIDASGDPVTYLSISFYWFVRDEAMYEAYVQELVYNKMRLEKLCPCCDVYIKVFITGGARTSNAAEQKRASHQYLDSDSKKLLRKAVLTERVFLNHDDNNNNNDDEEAAAVENKNNDDEDEDFLLSSASNEKKSFVSGRQTTHRHQHQKFRNSKRKEEVFSNLVKESLRRCKEAADDSSRLLTAPEDTSKHREALLRESIATYICAPPDMTSSLVQAFRAVEEKERADVEKKKAEEMTKLKMKRHNTAAMMAMMNASSSNSNHNNNQRRRSSVAANAESLASQLLEDATVKSHPKFHIQTFGYSV